MNPLKSLAFALCSILLGMGLVGCIDTEELLGTNDDAVFVEEDFVPSDAPGLMMWLDSSDSTTLFVDETCNTTVAENDGDLIGCWKDKSGNSFNAIQSDNSRKPELDAAIQNSNNGILFQDSSNQHLELPSGSWQSGSEYSAYIVYFQDTSDGVGALFSTYPGATTDFALTSRPTSGSNKSKILDHSLWKYASTNTAGDWNIDSFNRSGTAMSYHLDGLLDGQYNGLNTPTPSVAQIGAHTNDSSAFRGHIVEIIWYSNALSDEDRQKVEGLLAHKWGLTFQLPSNHPYRDEAPTTEVKVSL